MLPPSYPSACAASGNKSTTWRSFALVNIGSSGTELGSEGRCDPSPRMKQSSDSNRGTTRPIIRGITDSVNKRVGPVLQVGRLMESRPGARVSTKVDGASERFIRIDRLGGSWRHPMDRSRVSPSSQSEQKADSVARRGGKGWRPQGRRTSEKRRCCRRVHLVADERLSASSTVHLMIRRRSP